MSDKMETVGQMKQRHKLEVRSLQGEIKNFQKKAKKDKLNKKEMELAIQTMEEELKKRHEEELASLNPEDKNDAPEPPVVPPVPTPPQGPTKAQRRRENKKQKEREREERIQQENLNTVSYRQIESDSILSKLRTHQLEIKDIPSDGHCMYHAVADQLKRRNVEVPTEEPVFLYLRRLTSSYMLAHSDDFLPFIELDEGSGKSLTELFEEYCDRVASTSEWGGQLELRALAHALCMPIQVFTADSDIFTMGAEFDTKEPLQLTYHLHYYTLGEHYNSVVTTAI